MLRHAALVYPSPPQSTWPSHESHNAPTDSSLLPADPHVLRCTMVLALATSALLTSMLE